MGAPWQERVGRKKHRDGGKSRKGKGGRRVNDPGNLQTRFDLQSGVKRVHGGKPTELEA